MAKSRSPGIIYLLLLINSCCNQSSNAQSCSKVAENDLLKCACNFIRACVWDNEKKEFEPFSGSTLENLNPFLPSGLTVLAKDRRKIAEICEPGSIGIFYDCENRIPLAATIVLTAKQYESAYKRPPLSIQISERIDVHFQQNKDDYSKTSQREPCYEKQGHKRRRIEPRWNGKADSPDTLCPAEIGKSPIDRGHLISARYGLGPPGSDRIQKTFIFTNVVPQFSNLNRGLWRRLEGNLIEWARENCEGTPIHIIVGSVPSTFAANHGRFFGKSGFSDYSSNMYRVNVPAYIWTAACCFSPNSFTKSTFFVAANTPNSQVSSKDFSELFLRIGDHPSGPAKDIKLFPKWPDCHNDKNFVKIR